MLDAFRVRGPMCYHPFTAVLAAGRTLRPRKRDRLACPLSGSSMHLVVHQLQPDQRIRKDEADSPDVGVAWPISGEA